MGKQLADDVWQEAALTLSDSQLEAWPGILTGSVCNVNASCHSLLIGLFPAITYQVVIANYATDTPATVQLFLTTYSPSAPGEAPLSHLAWVDNAACLKTCTASELHEWHRRQRVTVKSICPALVVIGLSHISC